MLAAEPSKIWEVQGLAKASGADPVLLREYNSSFNAELQLSECLTDRLLRYVAITGLVKEISEGVFAASNLTTTAARPSFKSGLNFQ